MQSYLTLAEIHSIKKNVPICFYISCPCCALFCHTYAILLKIFTLYILLFCIFYAEYIYMYEVFTEITYIKHFGLTKH